MSVGVILLFVEIGWCSPRWLLDGRCLRAFLVCLLIAFLLWLVLHVWSWTCGCVLLVCFAGGLGV